MRIQITKLLLTSSPSSLAAGIMITVAEYVRMLTEFARADNYKLRGSAGRSTFLVVIFASRPTVQQRRVIDSKTTLGNSVAAIMPCCSGYARGYLQPGFFYYYLKAGSVHIGRFGARSLPLPHRYYSAQGVSEKFEIFWCPRLYAKAYFVAEPGEVPRRLSAPVEGWVKVNISEN